MTTKLTIDLPALHTAQQEIADQSKRFNALECGRRFGKTQLGQDRILHWPLQGYPAGWFAPTLKFLSPVWQSLLKILPKPLIKRVNTVERQIELITGGLIDFWSLEKPDAGRGRAYKLIVVDECSIVRNLMAIWQESLRPTLTDYEGGAWFLFTPKGQNDAHRLYVKGQEGEDNWVSWRKGSIENPYLSPQEIAEAQRELPQHVFDQEYLGIPADDGGNPFGLDAIKRCSMAGLGLGPPVCFGVDLAKAQDYTVICGLDEQGQICYLERFQSDWRQTKERIVAAVGTLPALVDSTGVGDAILEDLIGRGVNATGYIFTSRSKQLLMEALAAALQSDQVGVLEGWLVNELEMFQYEFTATGVKYAAPSGMHDDGVCALALANWLLVNKPPPLVVYSQVARTEREDINRSMPVTQSDFAGLWSR